MRYFIDTEFVEPVKPGEIDLISIALVAEDGREYYAIGSEFDLSYMTRNSCVRCTVNYFAKKIA